VVARLREPLPRQEAVEPPPVDDPRRVRVDPLRLAKLAHLRVGRAIDVFEAPFEALRLDQLPKVGETSGTRPSVASPRVARRPSRLGYAWLYLGYISAIPRLLSRGGLRVSAHLPAP
jgi:hypothetical protein